MIHTEAVLHSGEPLFCRLQKRIGEGIANEILMHFRSQKKTAGDVSLSEYIETGKDGNALSLIDIISSDEDLFEDLNVRELYRKLYQAMERVLTEREREILIYRYGLGQQPAETQRQVADRCGISRSYVSRIEKHALEKLRQFLAENDIN